MHILIYIICTVLLRSWYDLGDLHAFAYTTRYDFPDICAMVKSRYIGDGHPTFNRNPYNGYINPYYWVDDHPLLYGNIGSFDPGTYGPFN